MLLLIVESDYTDQLWIRNTSDQDLIDFSLKNANRKTCCFDSEVEIEG